MKEKRKRRMSAIRFRIFVTSCISLCLKGVYYQSTPTTWIGLNTSGNSTSSGLTCSRFCKFTRYNHKVSLFLLQCCIQDSFMINSIMNVTLLASAVHWVSSLDRKIIINLTRLSCNVTFHKNYLKNNIFIEYLFSHILGPWVKWR